MIFNLIYLFQLFLDMTRQTSPCSSLIRIAFAEARQKGLRVQVYSETGSWSSLYLSFTCNKNNLINKDHAGYTWVAPLQKLKAMDCDSDLIPRKFSYNKYFGKLPFKVCFTCLWISHNRCIKEKRALRVVSIQPVSYLRTWSPSSSSPCSWLLPKLYQDPFTPAPLSSATKPCAQMALLPPPLLVHAVLTSDTVPLSLARPTVAQGDTVCRMLSLEPLHVFQPTDLLCCTSFKNLKWGGIIWIFTCLYFLLKLCTIWNIFYTLALCLLNVYFI